VWSTRVSGDESADGIAPDETAAAEAASGIRFGRRDAVTAAVLLALVLFLRLGSFGNSVLDPDESLYLLIAQGILDGHTPYVEIWDHKPPGIYYLFAAAQFLFGRSIGAIRLLSCLAVWASCVLLVRFGRDVLSSTPVGYIAAGVYAAFSLTNDGLAANTEIFFTPFVIGGLYLIARNSYAARSTGGRASLFTAGLCFGIALQIKYVVVFELMLALAVAFAHWRQKDRQPRDLAVTMAMLAAGLLLPLSLVVALFLIAGAFSDYWYANFVANAIHSSNTPWSLAAIARAGLVQFRDNLLLWCAVIASAVWWKMEPEPRSATKRQLLLLVAWLAAAGIAVCVTRRFYPHYSLQMLPALSLITAFICWHSVAAGSAITRRRRAAPLALMLLPGVILVVYKPVEESVVTARAMLMTGNTPKDEPATIAEYLNAQISPDAYLYVPDYQPVLYYLVHARRPTRYLFPQFLTSRHFSRVAGVDPSRELEFIFVQRRPEYVVAANLPSSTRFGQTLSGYLTHDYTQERVFQGATVYRRKPPS